MTNLINFQDAVLNKNKNEYLDALWVLTKTVAFFNQELSENGESKIDIERMKSAIEKLKHHYSTNKDPIKAPVIERE